MAERLVRQIETHNSHELHVLVYLAALNVEGGWRLAGAVPGIDYTLRDVLSASVPMAAAMASVNPHCTYWTGDAPEEPAHG